MIPKSVIMNIDTGEKTWLTPKYIIDALGPFDLDPCCPPQMPWRTAKRMVCRPDDGLEVDWSNQRVWLNPPYGRESVPFIKKMAANQNGIAFLFGRTDTKAWHNYIFPYAYGILFLRGRIRFCHMDGTESQTAPAPSVLVGYSEYDLQILRDCGLDGFLIQLKTNNQQKRKTEMRISTLLPSEVFFGKAETRVLDDCDVRLGGEDGEKFNFYGE